MQTFGIVGQPNTTVTTFNSDYDRNEAQKVVNNPDIDADYDKVLEGVTAKNMRVRLAIQGAEETRYFPIS